MKILKQIGVFLTFATVFFVFCSNAFAQEKERGSDAWLLVGYGYSIPNNDQDKQLYGPLSLTIGGDIWRFIGLEVSLGTRWDFFQIPLHMGDQTLTGVEAVLWSFDIKPYLMLQPKLGVDMISVRPYFGIGPTFSFSGNNTTMEILGATSSTKNTSFDVGFSTKLGVRLQALKFLFVGIGAEYIYNKPTINNTTYDLSGFNVNGEIGVIF